jgi:hypothetical protein
MIMLSISYKSVYPPRHLPAVRQHQVWQNLMQAFFGEERSKGRTYSELYELVQHAGNVLPRL